MIMTDNKLYIYKSHQNFVKSNTLLNRVNSNEIDNMLYLKQKKYNIWKKI